MKVGFTGTRQGMTQEQYLHVARLLLELKSYQISPNLVVINEARHGCCIGADEQFNTIATTYQYLTFGHPASDVPAKNVSHCQVKILLPGAPALERNRTIIDASDVMIATPKGYEEEWRGSGTWAAIRYAQKVSKPLCLIYPDGTVDKCNGAK